MDNIKFLIDKGQLGLFRFRLRFYVMVFEGLRYMFVIVVTGLFNTDLEKEWIFTFSYMRK